MNSILNNVVSLTGEITYFENGVSGSFMIKCRIMVPHAYWSTLHTNMNVWKALWPSRTIIIILHIILGNCVSLEWYLIIIKHFLVLSQTYKWSILLSIFQHNGMWNTIGSWHKSHTINQTNILERHAHELFSLFMVSWTI